MAIYTVHSPKTPDGELAASEKIAFVRDDFSWRAFLFGPLWLAWNKAWLAAILWVAALGLLVAGGRALGLSQISILVMDFAAGVVLGFEGSRLVAWTLARRGYAEIAVAVGENLDEAEEAFFNARLSSLPSSPRSPDASAETGASLVAPGERAAVDAKEEDGA